MERNLFRYILIHSKTDQVIIFFVALVSQVFYFISLDLPKTIINVIQGKGFPSPDARQRVLDLSFEPPEWLRGLGLPEEVSARIEELHRAGSSAYRTTRCGRACRRWKRRGDPGGRRPKSPLDVQVSLRG